MLQNGCSLLPGRMRAFRSAARSARTSCRWSTCWSCSPAGTRTGSTCTSPRGTTRGTPEIEFDKSLHLSPRDSGFGPTRGPPAAQESQKVGRGRPVSSLGPPAHEFESPSEHIMKYYQVYERFTIGRKYWTRSESQGCGQFLTVEGPKFRVFWLKTSKTPPDFCILL